MITQVEHGFRYSYASVIASEPQVVFNYHAAPGALNRLLPPWEPIRVKRQGHSIDVGQEVLVRLSMMGIPISWLARHTLCRPPECFEDVQVSGPFAEWKHLHEFLPVADSPSRTTLHDSIHFSLPLAPLSNTASGLIARKLDGMFAYRHRTTEFDLALHRFLIQRGMRTDRPLRIAITGSSGLIGRRLVDLISVLGHQAIRIVRANTRHDATGFPHHVPTVQWDASRGFAEESSMNDLDAVIHLAGKNIAAGRWTAKVRQELISSRVDATRNLISHLARLQVPPISLVCASGVGIYGEQGDAIVEETHASNGNDFLVELASRWEEAAMTYQRLGKRVAIGRLATVMHPREGALAVMLKPFRIGMGGPMGSGEQYWNWIHVDDAAAAFLYLSACTECYGAYNFASEPLRNRDFSRILAEALHRPNWVRTPAAILKMLLGDMGSELLLTSCRVQSKRLQEVEFPFRAKELRECLNHLLGIVPTSESAARTA